MTYGPFCNWKTENHDGAKITAPRNDNNMLFSFRVWKLLPSTSQEVESVITARLSTGPFWSQTDTQMTMRLNGVRTLTRWWAGSLKKISTWWHCITVNQTMSATERGQTMETERRSSSRLIAPLGTWEKQSDAIISPTNSMSLSHLIMEWPLSKNAHKLMRSSSTNT